MWGALLTGQVWHGELVNRRKDDSLYHEEMTVTPVRDAQGEVTHFIAIKQDISERKRAEEALRQARDEVARANADLERKVRERTAQLVEANANLRTFTYAAAHDLGAPLRAIQGLSGMAAEACREKLGPQERILLERVVASADQMQRLLKDLLEYSKMSQAELKLGPVDLRKAVSEALELLEEEIRGKKAVVTVTEPLPPVIGHPATVGLLISNLVSNGLKFMPPGVQPQVRIWAESGTLDDGSRGAPESGSDPADAPRLALPTPAVRLWVQDNGIGIALEHQERIFGAFERLHCKGDFPGTGLGLAIVRKGVERMGGRVGVESEPGKGSRFWIELRRVEG
jgi:signal transduction histidine kinase